jgi:hypothetical protein
LHAYALIVFEPGPSDAEADVLAHPVPFPP